MKNTIDFRALPGIICLALMLSVAGISNARAELPGFDAMMESVQKNYRTGAFYCRIRSTGVAIIEVDQLVAKWQVIAATYADAPPEQFSDDPQWKSTLASVQEALAQAKTLLEQDQPRKAFDALEDYAQALAELRRRNEIYDFSDRIRDFNTQRLRLVPYRDFNEALSDEGYLAVREVLAIMEFIVGGMDTHAPASRRADATFQEAVDGLRESLRLMRQNLDKRLERGVKGSIRDINSSFFLLFMKFG